MDVTPETAHASTARREAFGYDCHRCLRCCHHKVIQLNPYEVARLARNRGQTTTEFRAASTLDGAGVVLAQTADGACVFLGNEGCTVHPDRPLVCRLYPLGRHVNLDGEERFSRVMPHPQSEGEYHTRGTIADFLESQGAGPFMEAADEYLAWMARALEALRSETGQTPQLRKNAEGDDARLLDMDAAIHDHCSSEGLSEPADIEARKRLHLSILHQQLETL